MIQDGCEHFCSYCIVPFARGKVTSKPLDQIIAEAKQLVSAGAREIILTGINLGTYQHDLSSVIRRLSSIPNLMRIRISSVEPMYLTRKLIDTVAQTPGACHHFHLPLQSGDNEILKAMQRNYTAEDYLGMIDYIRSKIPDCGISTDIIVGFPGEGEKEFKNTLLLVKRAGFSRLHIFPYSKRKGTAAVIFPGQISTATKKQRSKLLSSLNRQLMCEFAGRYLGGEVEILVEQKGEGLTSNYIRCHFNDPPDSSGSHKIILARSVNNLGEIRA
jgi:threonylcarbamoyladenosine tRNA methylthiotransferase MtaB